MNNSKIHPPKSAQWLLSKFCPSEFIEDILGDMEEEFIHNLDESSPSKAKIQYWKDTLSLLFSYALVKRRKDHATHTFSKTQNNLPMLKNYIKVALRSLAKQRLFTIINILGLSAGMSIGILFITMISFVDTYDSFHENGSRIYRIITETDKKVRTKDWASTPVPLAQLLSDDYSGFGKLVRINNTLNAEAEYNNKTLPINGLFVDNNFLEVFSFDLLSGENDLKDPSTILITESFAKKMFNEESPLGNIIDMGDLGEFTISGVIKDVPKNSHMWFEALLPHQVFLDRARYETAATNPKAWTEFYNNYLYLLLPENSNIAALNSTLEEISLQKYKSMNAYDAKFKLQHLSEIAMGSDTGDELGTSWGIEIYLISISITLLILLPACFNYTNISTARALGRAKEIGMRKVVGGVKKQIFLQFILETVIISLVSLVGAYAIFMFIRVEFQTMLVAGITSMDFSITTLNLLYSILFAVLTGVLAGIFPAIHFAGIKPIAALKKTTTSQLFGKVNFQKTLLVIQFALSFGFIMGVVVFIDQYRTAVNYDLGFAQENILDIDLQGVDPEILRTHLDGMAAVTQVSMSSSILGVNSGETIWLPHKDDSTDVTQMYIDHNYFENLKLELIAGKPFESSFSNNEQFVIVNEQFIQNRGIDNATMAIGQPIQMNDSTELVISGVMKNFHFKNLSRKIEPLIFRYNKEHFRYANVKLSSNEVAQTISDIENKWKKLSPL
ncbi:MAG: ABC transporter permease, partial [Fulvivirga sp.]|uniref:ABC transporter permease n=1 Tax=Fulvivirga sp. TaxID=1931237 RepID=UPI0032EFF334